jgi:ubiquinone/menaquinone biosynthesis C-methylase UbiE
MSEVGSTGQSTESVHSVQSFWEGHVNNEYYTDEERASVAYFDEIRERRYRWHYHLRELFDELAGSDGDLLEIGCGIGVDSIELARCGFRVTGIDLTQAAIDIAKQHAAHRQVEIAFQRGNAEALEFSDNAFDAVYSFGVLHHTPNMRRAISEVHRVLKPGGTAFVMLYHRFSIVEQVHKLFRIPYESPKNLKDHCPVVYRISRKDAAEYFGDFGKVEITADYPFTYGFRYLTFWMPAPLKKWLGRSIGWHLMIRAVK